MSSSARAPSGASRTAEPSVPRGAPPESRRAPARDIGSWPAPPAPVALDLPPLPNRMFFRIGEVAELVGVKAHVLRYWESELGLLRPMKTRGSHRQYRRRDVEIARLVRQLTEVEGYTIAGAKKKIAELRGAKKERTSLSRDLTAIRDDLLSAAALFEASPMRRHSFDLAGGS